MQKIEQPNSVMQRVLWRKIQILHVKQNISTFYCLKTDKTYDTFNIPNSAEGKIYKKGSAVVYCLISQQKRIRNKMSTYAKAWNMFDALINKIKFFTLNNVTAFKLMQSKYFSKQLYLMIFCCLYQLLGIDDACTYLMTIVI